MQELQELHSSTEVQELGIRVAINEADITDVAVELDGPPGMQQSLQCAVLLSTLVLHSPCIQQHMLAAATVYANHL